MAYSKKRKACLRNASLAQNKRRKLDNDPLLSGGGVDQGHSSANQLIDRSPPSLSSAIEALAKLSRIIRPRRKTRYGHKRCPLNEVTRARCEAMTMCLRRYITPPRCGFVKASRKVARMLGKGRVAHARRIRYWVRVFIATGRIPINAFGTHNTSAINDESVAEELKLLLRSKGKYLCAQDLVDILASPGTRMEIGILRPINVRTARRWLRQMGYRWKNELKGQYFDGHERADVVHYRKNVFLPAWKSIELFVQLWDKDTGLPIMLVLNNGRKRIIVWWHDQSTFYAHDRRRRRWVHAKERALPSKKGEGVSMGVSDYISELGFLRSKDGASSARKTIFAGGSRDGYWTNNDICAQLKEAVKLAKQEYPEYDHVFVYDNASIHTKKRPTAPSARYMSKKVTDFGVWVEQNNGKKEKTQMDDGVFPDGSTQSFYFPDNHPVHPRKFKGMEILLRERGIEAAHLKAQCKDFKCISVNADCCCRRILYNIIDVDNSPTILESLAESLGSRVIFLPKYHCELNPIEQLICYPPVELLKALAEVPGTSIEHFVQRVHRFIDAYVNGNDGTQAAQWARRTFKRHRETPEHIPSHEI